MVLPLEIEKIIPHNDPVFKLVEICEKLDYSRLEKEYVRSWRKLNPATMFIAIPARAHCARLAGAGMKSRRQRLIVKWIVE